jgi:beta-lactamase class A
LRSSIRSTLRVCVSASIAAWLLCGGPSMAQVPKAAPLPVPVDRVALQSALAAIARDAQGTLGVGVERLGGGTGEQILSGGGTRYPMQSVYKLPIAMAALQLVDRGTLRLDRPIRVTRLDYVTPGQHSPLRDRNPDGTTITVRELLSLAVSESDGTASDVLLRLIGGPLRAMTFVHAIGVTDIAITTTERMMGLHPDLQFQNWITPAGALSLLRAVDERRGLSPASQALLLQMLSETTTYPGRLKAGLPPGTPIAHKTGTSGTANGVTAASNDIGLVTLPDGRRLAIAVFLMNSRADDAARDATIAAVARAAWHAFVPLAPAPVPAGDLPPFVRDLIKSFEAAPVANPPASISRYEYQGRVVYYVPPRCCDVPSTLYDDKGAVICQPDGGFTGRGNNKCADFFDARSKGVTIWKDPRSRLESSYPKARTLTRAVAYTASVNVTRSARTPAGVMRSILRYPIVCPCASSTHPSRVWPSTR